MKNNHINIVPLDSRERFFCVPNAIYMMDLKAVEIAIYCYLLRCEDRKTYTCYPSFNTIAKAIGVSLKTVANHIHVLEEKKLISIKHTHMNAKDGAVLNGTLEYHINPISWALRDFYERKLSESEVERRRNNLWKKAEGIRLVG